jgi:hypothetical protein
MHTAAPSISLAEYHKLVAGGAVHRARVRRKNPEEQLHLACFEWILLNQARYPILRWLIHVPNGGKRPRGEAGKMKAMGVRKGVLDFLLPFQHNGYAGLLIELKSGNNDLTPEQIEWKEQGDKEGYLTAVCWSLEEFIKAVLKFVDTGPLSPQ